MGNSEDKFISSILKEKREKFPDFEIKEGLLCDKCDKKQVPDTFQLSGMNICRDCYNKDISNYSYYESKYSKKVSKPQNYEVNTTYHVHKNNQNLEFYSNEN